MEQILFGAFAIHNPESCPMNNVEAKKVFLEIKDKLEQNKSKYGVKKIESFYMSVLEHEWMIIFEANSAHDIESLCIEAGIASFNTVKIVALRKYEDVQNKIKK
ncbi:MAG TPA: hypothetical protein VFM28_00640 [Nitrososphaeraceae archaeon]|jgi:hypothetical protein|nr:hypothetical protein [Nitrososphaeraceae archaeon]